MVKNIVEKTYITGQEVSNLYGYSLSLLGERCNDGFITCYDKHHNEIRNASSLDGTPVRTEWKRLDFYQVNDFELGTTFPNAKLVNDKYYIDKNHVLFINQVIGSKEDIRNYRQQMDQTACRDCFYPLDYSPCQFFCTFRDSSWSIELELSKIRTILEKSTEYTVEFNITRLELDVDKLCKHANNITTLQKAIKENKFIDIINHISHDYFDNFSVLSNIVEEYKRTFTDSQENEKLEPLEEDPILKEYIEFLTYFVDDKNFQNIFLEFSENYRTKYSHILSKYIFKANRCDVDDTELLQTILNSNRTLQEVFQSIAPIPHLQAVDWKDRSKENYDEQKRIESIRNYIKEFFLYNLMRGAQNIFMNSLKSQDEVVEVKFTKIDTHICAEVVSPDCFAGISNLSPTKEEGRWAKSIKAKNKEEAINFTYRAKYQQEYYNSIFREDYFYFDFEMYKNIIAYDKSENDTQKDYSNYIAESYFLQKEVADAFQNELILTQEEIESDPIRSLIKICEVIEKHQKTPIELKKGLYIYYCKLGKMLAKKIYVGILDKQYIKRKPGTHYIQDHSYPSMLSQHWKQAQTILQKYNLYFTPIFKNNDEYKDSIIKAINSKKQFIIEYGIKIL